MSKEKKVVRKLLEDVRLMRMKQISAYTSLSKGYIYKLMKEGGFPESVALKGIRMWEKSAIDEWLNRSISGGK